MTDVKELIEQQGKAISRFVPANEFDEYHERQRKLFEALTHLSEQNAAKNKEIAELRDILTTLCFYWDEMLNNIDCGPEYEARKAADKFIKQGRF